MTKDRKKGDGWGWHWPVEGQNSATTMDNIGRIVAPYQVGDGVVVPTMCYPGTNLDPEVVAVAAKLLPMQINAIGSHTHGEYDANGCWQAKDGEGGFESIQTMEAQTIWMIASMLGASSPADVDGYFCGGGTEANLQGMWVGREFLLQNCPVVPSAGEREEVVVFATALTHYSIAKGANLLGLGYSRWGGCPHCDRSHLFVPDQRGCGLHLVGMDERGQMSVDKLEEMFKLKYDQGFRRFIVVPTVGTCALGSIDPVQQIGQFIRENKGDAQFYMHVDASFGGFTVPFVDPDLPIGFNVPEVGSITVDADKMGRLPYPAGVFLCRKGLMELVERRVEYVRGHGDDTVSGSRSCIAPVAGWHLYQREGIVGQRKYVEVCLAGRNRLLEIISERDLPWIRPMPHSSSVNFAPLIIDIEAGGVPEELCEGNGILAGYHLRYDFFQPDPGDGCPSIVYKICVMPHAANEAALQKFVDDLIAAKQQWVDR